MKLLILTGNQKFIMRNPKSAEYLYKYAHLKLTGFLISRHKRIMRIYFV